jgi:prephenate dehydrogenase
MKKLVVSVYGYGRFGKFWGDILAKDFHVKVYSRRGLNAGEVSEGIEITTEEDIFNCDAIFFCVSISSFKAVLENSVEFFTLKPIYFDTCSVKVAPARWMQRYLPKGSKIIATHPMFGPDSYNEKKDLPIVMSNLTALSSEFEFWKQYFSTKQMRVEDISVDEHDHKVAYSQGITHFLGRVLADLHLKQTNIDTLGYLKLLEIMDQTCNDSWQLFMDMQNYNHYTKKMRVDLQNSLEKIMTILSIKEKE